MKGVLSIVELLKLIADAIAWVVRRREMEEQRDIGRGEVRREELEKDVETLKKWEKIDNSDVTSGVTDWLSGTSAEAGNTDLPDLPDISRTKRDS